MVALADSWQVLTHKDLPDEDAFWRLTGAEGTPPSRQRRHRRRRERGVLAQNRGSHASFPTRNNAITALLILAILTVVVADATDGAPLYDAAAGIYNFMNSAPGMPEWLLYIALGAIPVVLVHEIGHAMAARRLLDTPVTVTIGSFGELAQLHLGHISMSLKAFSSPTRMAGSAEFDASRARAQDILLNALAGPAASAAGLLISIPALATVPEHGALHDLLWATTFGSAFAVLNLVPFTYQERRYGPTHQSDGRLALDAARAVRALR
ncbi:MAG: hypothetical protein M3401_15180 [Actinomycetota bacterium]|nr:hypothetical protein [Actinomycetota bacterium]